MNIIKRPPRLPVVSFRPSIDWKLCNIVSSSAGRDLAAPSPSVSQRQRRAFELRIISFLDDGHST
jgi:hypothetical protein